MLHSTPARNGLVLSRSARNALPGLSNPMPYKQIPLKRRVLASLLMAGLTAPLVSLAQQAPRTAAQALMEEIVVTARKREENSQDVPLAISAFGEDQIEALKVRDLESLAVGMPNVSLDDAGTTPGYANFSIRGLGINSSIVSIDPTVGVFVDGVYLGLAAGQVFDMFDLESIEVLRGPQGTLFGRNVTGGAILVNTKKPGDELEGNVAAGVDGGGDGGLNKFLKASISGPLSDTFAAKAAVAYSDDDGWFENQYNGEDYGANEQTMARLTGVWTPTDSVEVIGRYEYTETDGDGPVAQNHINADGVPGFFATFDRDEFDVSNDEPGFSKTESNMFALETNVDVAFGDGTITNIFGWRTYESRGLGDIDGQPAYIFHTGTWIDSEQYSNELRYSGTFGERTTLTTGVYYFTNDVDYHERRLLVGVDSGFNALINPNTGAVVTADTAIAPATIFDGGGLHDVTTMGAFASVDYDLTDDLILTAGLRYTYEEKEAEVVSLSQNRTRLEDGLITCHVYEPEAGEATCVADFVDDKDWSYVSPKLGLTYHLSDDARVYGHWSRGIRSGGYNLRNTSDDPADVPGPFDEETVDSFELGYKADYGRGRLNAAVFYNKVSDMQRELNFDGDNGVIQLIRNTADADIYGIEIDSTWSLTDSLLLTASVGLLDAEYSEVIADLNRDGVVDSADESLDLPRAPEVTYSIGLNHDIELGSLGLLSSRISYSYRDESAYTDDNRGYIDEQKIVDLGIDFSTFDGRWGIGLYGKNLTNEVKQGNDTQLPSLIGGLAPTGGTFAPLSKGRVIGVQVSFNY